MPGLLFLCECKHVARSCTARVPQLPRESRVLSNGAVLCWGCRRVLVSQPAFESSYAIMHVPLCRCWTERRNKSMNNILGGWCLRGYSIAATEYTQPSIHSKCRPSISVHRARSSPRYSRCHPDGGHVTPSLHCSTPELQRCPHWLPTQASVG